MKSRSIMTLECPWYLSFFLFNNRLFYTIDIKNIHWICSHFFAIYKIQFPLDRNLIKKKSSIHSVNQKFAIRFIELSGNFVRWIKIYRVAEPIAIYLQIKFSSCFVEIWNRDPAKFEVLWSFKRHSLDSWRYRTREKKKKKERKEKERKKEWKNTETNFRVRYIISRSSNSFSRYSKFIDILFSTKKNFRIW